MAIARARTTFQSTPSTQRETLLSICIFRPRTYFNPLPLRRGRPFWFAPCVSSIHFNPLPLRRGRQFRLGIQLRILLKFQSTPSTQRETIIVCLIRRILQFQSTPSTQRETLPEGQLANSIIFQSTPSTQRETRNTRSESGF